MQQNRRRKDIPPGQTSTDQYLSVNQGINSTYFSKPELDATTHPLTLHSPDGGVAEITPSNQGISRPGLRYTIGKQYSGELVITLPGTYYHGFSDRLDLLPSVKWPLVGTLPGLCCVTNPSKRPSKRPYKKPKILEAKPPDSPLNDADDVNRSEDSVRLVSHNEVELVRVERHLSKIDDMTTTKPTGPFTPDFDAVVERLLQEFHVPGLSIAVVHGEETYAKGYGYARVASLSMPPKPMTPQTLLGTASTTKAFTALALAQVVHGEQSPKDIDTGSSKRPPITWQTPVSTLLPGDFVLPTRDLTQSVTIEDILCHRTGVPSCDNACLSWGAGAHADTPASITRKLRYFPLPTNTTPATMRTRFIYSNTMYAAAQHLVETLIDQPLQKVLRERTFDVLGMGRTFFGFHDVEERGKDITADMAKGYRWVPGGDNEAADNECEGKYVEVPWRGSPEQGGAGDIISCVSDYALWMRAVLSRDSRVLSEEGWTEVLWPRMISDDKYPAQARRNFGTQTYALGWSGDHYRGEKIIEHTGRDPGIGTLVHLLPAHEYGIAIFANTSNTSNTLARIVSMHLTDNLLDVPTSQRIDFAALACEEAAKEAEDEAYKNFADKSRKLFPETEKGGPAAYQKVELGFPLSSCAGRYRHPGYGVIDVQTMKLGEVRQRRRSRRRSGQLPSAAGAADTDDDLRDILFVDMNDRTFPAELVLLHHNAGFFVVEEWDTLESQVTDWWRGEVRIGVRGEVVAVGIGFAEDDGVEGCVWFDRIYKEA
ncbi:beta-lactamase/transpeptidase-like protein [Lepidopterella palustris CBS 459.81]|uniref:Beta-lactamase/transpeptidase-like protein n=1 Tax=Lepidopterella palustris CBS 459.81 TaxID=1314670 RepID=A0A8E2E882_9PEZI|nr:beta-lactamase/transpeptidase-like protein [Lepidopterella palustris CBS 459.81]